MTLHEIRKMPTSITVIPVGSSGVHESCLRSYHIVRKIEELLIEETPPKIILEVIADLRSAWQA